MSKEAAIDIDRLSQSKPFLNRDKYKNKPEKVFKRLSSKNICTRCSYDEHKNMDYCTARKAECRKYKKTFAIMCRTSTEEIKHIGKRYFRGAFIG